MATRIVYTDSTLTVTETTSDVPLPDEPGGWRSLSYAWASGTPVANEATIVDRLDQALAPLNAHVSRGTFTTTQRDAALLLCLRVCVGLIRVIRRRVETTD